jgi:hypothetical protein
MPTKLTFRSPLRRCRRWIIAAAALVSSLAAQGLAVPAADAGCEVGGGPGSTLLLPYFEVDLSDPGGLTTLFSVNNETSTTTVVRVVVWSDWAIPIMAFDIFLAGRDLQTINVRDLLNGNLPSTSGDFTGFQFCSGGGLPTYPPLTGTQIAQIRANLTGVAGPTDGLCAGEFYGDNHARGYITIDAVDQCSGLGLPPSITPVSSTYFPGVGVVKNFLWGDLFFVDPGQNSAQGVEAVNIVADNALAAPNTNTFYGRYRSFNGQDRRSPLPTTWNTRFLNGGVFDGGTDLLVFRDTRSSSISRRVCGTHPTWYPLQAQGVFVRDEDANLKLSQTPNGDFPLATQRVRIADLGPTGPGTAFGRVQIQLNQPGGNPTGAWVIPVMKASGRFSLDFNGQPSNSGCGLDPTP